MTVHRKTPNSKVLVQRLQEKIRRVEASSRNDDGTIIPSGSPATDAILPAGGYHRGTIIQWFAENGSGAKLLSLKAAQNAASEGGAIVIIDPQNRFYPPAARALGINLSNLIVLRQPNPNARTQFTTKKQTTVSPKSGPAPLQPQNQQPEIDRPKPIPSTNDLLWAIDQSLRCSAVAAVWGELPVFETPQIETRWQRRFQLSAESSGCCGMFTRKPSNPKNQNAITSASWAEVQWHIQSLTNTTRSGNTRLVRASLWRCRGGVSGKTVDLKINTITGNVLEARREHATGQQQTAYSLPLATQLAHPKIGRRAARA